MCDLEKNAVILVFVGALNKTLVFLLTNGRENNVGARANTQVRPYDVKVMFTFNFTFTAIVTGPPPVKIFPEKAAFKRGCKTHK